MSPPTYKSRPNDIDPDPDVDQLRQLAENVRYAPHPKHKSYPIEGQTRSVGKGSSPATLCPTEFKEKSNKELAKWVAIALRKGAVSSTKKKDYPSPIWYMDEDGNVYQAWITNPGNGTYHGHPIPEDQWPKGIEDYYD